MSERTARQRLDGIFDGIEEALTGCTLEEILEEIREDIREDIRADGQDPDVVTQDVRDLFDALKRSTLVR